MKDFLPEDVRIFCFHCGAEQKDFIAKFVGVLSDGMLIYIDCPICKKDFKFEYKKGSKDGRSTK